MNDNTEIQNSGIQNRKEKFKTDFIKAFKTKVFDYDTKSGQDLALHLTNFLKQMNTSGDLNPLYTQGGKNGGYEIKIGNLETVFNADGKASERKITPETVKNRLKAWEKVSSQKFLNATGSAKSNDQVMNAFINVLYGGEYDGNLDEIFTLDLTSNGGELEEGMATNIIKQIDAFEPSAKILNTLRPKKNIITRAYNKHKALGTLKAFKTSQTMGWMRLYNQQMFDSTTTKIKNIFVGKDWEKGDFSWGNIVGKGKGLWEKNKKAIDERYMELGKVIDMCFWDDGQVGTEPKDLNSPGIKLVQKTFFTFDDKTITAWKQEFKQSLGKGVKPDDEKRKWKIFYLEKQLKALSNYVQGNQFDPLVGGGKTRTTFQEALEHEGSKEKLQFAAKFLMKKIGKEKAEVLGEGEPGGEKKEETTQEEVVEDKYYEFNALFKTQEKVDEENIEDGKTEELATSDSLEAELDKIFKGERLEKGVGREIRGDELKEVTEKARDTKQGTSKNSGAIKPR